MNNGRTNIRIKYAKGIPKILSFKLNCTHNNTFAHVEFTLQNVHGLYIKTQEFYKVVL